MAPSTFCSLPLHDKFQDHSPFNSKDVRGPGGGGGWISPFQMCRIYKSPVRIESNSTAQLFLKAKLYSPTPIYLTRIENNYSSFSYDAINTWEMDNI